MVGMFFAEGLEGDLVVVGLGDLVGPGFKFGAGPFEAVVAVSELAGFHSFEEDVVFDIGRGDDDVGRAGAFENDAREGFESGRIEVFDDFDKRCDIVISKAGVAVDDRALQKSEAFIVLSAWAGDESFLRDFERARIDVHSGDFWDRGLFEKAVEELALAATEIENRGRSEGFYDFGDAIDAEGMKGDLFFDFGLCGVFFGIAVVGFRSEAGEGFTGETTLEFEVSGDDPVSLGVILEPVLAFRQELFNFLLADPVVLLPVEDGDENEKVLEEGLEGAGFAEGDVVNVALAPVGEVGIERSGLAGDFVSERSEEALELGLAAWGGKGREAGGEIEFLVDEFGVLLAGAIEGRAQDAGDRCREEGGGDEGAVVDVLSEGPAGLARAL